MQLAIPPHDVTRARRLPNWLLLVLGLLALAALAVPVLLIRTTPPIHPVAKRVVQPTRVVPKAELPPVEPTAFQDLAPTDARAFNATVPFSTAPNPAARPFRIFGDSASQARAIDCLAAAAIFEAGDDTDGQKSVVQVVLNRVRHPAFPHTVCGVVFQGSERRTGCQFTFTCDGAMMRPVMPAAWTRARQVARTALNGAVDARVGHATHYHTDWVVPYWSSSLDKITAVKTHLFFRWSGWWGTPPAFASRYTGIEPAIPQLGSLSDAHRTAAEELGLSTITPAVIDPAVVGDAMLPRDGDNDTNTFLAGLDPDLDPSAFPALAERTCGQRPYCKFMAWSRMAGRPAALPVTPAQQRLMSFSYLRDRAYGFEKALWNCNEFKRADPTQCMKAQVSISMVPPPPTNLTNDAAPGSANRAIVGAPPGASLARPAGPDPLTGVRRKVENGPVPMTNDVKAPPPPVKPTLPATKEP